MNSLDQKTRITIARKRLRALRSELPLLALALASGNTDDGGAIRAVSAILEHAAMIKVTLEMEPRKRGVK